MPSPPSSADAPDDGPLASGGDVAHRPSRRALVLLAVICVVVPLLVLVAALAGDGDDDGPLPGATGLSGAMPAPGEMAPAFDQPGLDGGRVRLSDFRGRPLVLTFFASWCNPCEQELPLLNDALVEHADEGLAIAGVVFEEPIADDTRRFRARLGSTWPAATDDNGDVATAYGVRLIPVTFFIGPDGRIVDRAFGITSQTDLEEPLAALLAASRSAGASAPPSDAG